MQLRSREISTKIKIFLVNSVMLSLSAEPPKIVKKYGQFFCEIVKKNKQRM